MVLQRLLHVVDKPLEFSTPSDVQVEPVPVPEPVEEPEPEPVATPDPVRPRPVRPRPVRPRPSPVKPTAEPEPSEPDPVQPEPVPSPEAAVLAPIRLTGDAVTVRALGVGQSTSLPASLPPGRYDVEVVFAGGEPFVAASLLVMDAQPQTVACREALGICTVK